MECCRLLLHRCPGLRNIIEDLWDSGGGGLELGLDASFATLDSICQFMHTGVFIAPTQYFHQLELIKVVSELEMINLRMEAFEILREQMTEENAPFTMEFAQTFGMYDLESICHQFLQYGKKENVIDVKLLPSYSVMSPGNGNNRSLSNNDNSNPNKTKNGDINTTIKESKSLKGGSNLQQEVWASLKDVDDLLNPLVASMPVIKEKEREKPTLSSTSVSAGFGGIPGSSFIEANDRYQVTAATEAYPSSMLSSNEKNSLKSKSSASASTSMNVKLKSGGIYALLLENSELGEDSMHSDLGSLYDDSVVFQSQTSSKMGSQAGSTKNSSNQSGNSSISLASNKNSTKSKANQSKGSAAGVKIMEFDKNMSIVPEKPLSEREKRYHDCLIVFYLV